MMISREYLGVVLIAVVFSTILTLFIIGERPERPVEILRNEAPPLQFGSDQKFGYAFSLVFRRDSDEVKVKFSWFRPMTMLLTENATGATFEEVLPKFQKIRMLDHFLSAFDAKPERIEQNFWPETYPDSQTLILDYSGALKVGMTEISHLVHPIYIFVLKDGKITDYYEGIADYFPEREWREFGGDTVKPVRDPRTSGSVEFGLDENRTKYVSLGEKRLMPELHSVYELPPYGELTFTNVKKDQRLTVMTFVSGRALGFVSQREMIRVYLNGKLEMIQIN